MSPYFYILPPRSVHAQSRFPKRPEPPRVVGAGHVVRLLTGQGHGFIRAGDGREVYFHRADMHESRSFNSLQIGDSVTFELFDDRISGARALRVVRRRR